MENGETIAVPFKDLYCIARLLKSSLARQGNPFEGCQYCRFQCHAAEPAPNYNHVVQRLNDITGVTFNYSIKDMENLQKEGSPSGENDF